jgi:hypothetical protein
MALLTSQTTIEIAAPGQVITEVADLVLLPENSGISALRELHYPDDVLPPLIYEAMPTKWENFDSAPLTAQPGLSAAQTLADTILNRWPGTLKDLPVKEYWCSSEDKSVMSAYFFRRLAEFFLNPPPDGQYITWWPKDRTATGYQIEIESLTAGGKDVLTLNYPQIYHGCLAVEVVFAFRIIGELV